MRATVRAVWKRLYDPRRGHRIPALLLNDAKRAIPAVVDEIAFQPRRGLGGAGARDRHPLHAARPGGDPRGRRAARAPACAARFAAALPRQRRAPMRSRRALTPRDLNELVLDLLAPQGTGRPIT